MVNLDSPSRESAAATYARLENDRKPYITRAEDCAKFTIPSLFPKESDTSSTEYKTPNQSVGARGVNNLASKLLLALFPPNSPFFRLSMQENTQAQLTQMDEKVKQQVDQALSRLETKLIRYIETNQIRVTVREALNQLIVAGNALLFLPPKEGGAKLYKLSSYVLQRDALGNPLQIVAVDKLVYATVPPNVKQLLDADGKTRKADEVVTIYTHVYLEGDSFRSYQEVEEKLIEGSEQIYPAKKNPWIPLRLIKVDGESYGRSFVEEYLGDLKQLDGLQEAMLNASTIMAHILYLVNPAGITQPRKLAKAKTGDFVPGRLEDINALQTDKRSDMQTVMQAINALESRLSFIFMLNSAVQRDAERVTAEEIRYVAQELEDTLGGTYSILSQELQLPLVRRLMVQLEGLGEIPTLPDNTVEPTITTGLEALGRGHDLNKLIMFRDFIGSIPEAAQMLNMDSLVLMVANSLGLDTTGLVKSQEQLQQEQEQAQMMMLAQQATPNVAKGAMDAMNAQPTE